jgi:carboxymethylenebutenolidase
MPRADVTIKTRDGNCPASVFTPANGNGPWPAVIFYMDGLGIRPVMWEMGQRLSDGGYLVLQPDLYYRFGSYPPKVASEVLGNPKSMEELMKLVNSLDRDRKVSDSGAFIEFLSSRPDVKGKRFGATGYCMGGNASLTAAGAFPDRFAAIASFHGGNLGADKPDSPHQFVKNIWACVCRGRDRGREFSGGAENPPRKGFDRCSSQPRGRDLSRRTPRLCGSRFAGL